MALKTNGGRFSSRASSGAYRRSRGAGKPEGPFWLAANMGALAESFGLRAGLRYRKPIKEALETVLSLDPAFQNGSADRALGRWYFRVPGLFGGSNKEAEAHLRTSLQYDQNSTITHFFLAEVLLEEGRKSEARAELQKVIDAPFNPEWAPEDDDYRARARATGSRSDIGRRPCSASPSPFSEGVGVRVPAPGAACRRRHRRNAAGDCVTRRYRSPDPTSVRVVPPAPSASGAAAARTRALGTPRT